MKSKNLYILIGAAAALVIISLLFFNQFQSIPELQDYGVYVANEDGSSISVIDGATLSVIDAIHIEKSNPHNVNLDPLGRYIYATNHEETEHGHEMGGAGFLRVIDANTRKLIKSVDLGAKAAHVVPTRDGLLIYVSLEGSDHIVEIDTADFSIKRDIPVGEMPHGFVLSSKDDFLFSPNMMSNDVTSVNLETGESKAFEVSYEDNICKKPTAMGITSDDKYAFVTCSDSFDIYKIDVANLQVIGRSAFAKNTFPGPIQSPVNPTDMYLYIPDMQNGVVHKIDIETFEELVSIKTGSGAHGIAYSPVGKYAFVTNTWDNSLSIIDTTSDTIIKTIYVGKSPNGVAVSGGKNQGW